MIDEALIESDEDGFHLVLHGDFPDLISAGARLDLRLTQDAAIQLLGQVRRSIGPWVDDMEDALASYRRATPAERRAVLAPVAGVMTDQDVPDFIREGVDLIRKAARENA